MSLITPGLYIGNFRDAQDMNFLQRNGISHILCSAAELQPVFKNKFKYKHVQANDIPTYNISRHFDSAADFIHEALSENGSILVHCAAGISRSVSLALAYYIKHQNKKLHDSLNMIKSRRFIANPNPGFIKQLKEYEGRVTDSAKKTPIQSAKSKPSTNNPSETYQQWQRSSYDQQFVAPNSTYSINDPR